MYNKSRYPRYSGPTLERCVMNDIYAAKSWNFYSQEELAGYVCDKWRIDRVQEIREVFQAVESLYPNLRKR